ncbi:MAG: hypothetical protein KBC30_04430 [Planctomycetes bacterium]|nr:hypothetical protein [Planctomycetota bacterium]HPY75216.1 hypothetical protein [Planctomycetota bacterium]HQB00498.1 hypothetical protein [Planctomycetota bacterium]
MQIFQGSPQELKEKYNLAPMVIVWIGILRSKNYLTTEPFLELCTPNGPLEPLIKDRTLQSVLDKPSEFEKLQAQYDPERHYPIVILDKGTHKVLALEAEVLSEAGWKKDVQELGLQTTSNKQIELQIPGIDNLFPSQEMARLKMVLATAVRSEEKIEAIRKISLSPISQQEKSLLFLHALMDADRLVRLEAILALGRLGLSQEIVHGMEILNQVDPLQQKYALNTLGTLFSKANDMAQASILQILLTILTDKEYKHCAANMFQAFTKIIPILSSENIVILEKIMSGTILLLLEQLDDRQEEAEKLFHAIAIKNEQLLHIFLSKEIEKADKARLRAFLLLILIENNVPITESLLEKIVFEVGLGDELDTIYTRLNYSLICQGEKAVPALLKRFDQSIRVTERISIIHLLDQIHEKHTTSTTWYNQVLKIFIKVFPSAPEELRFSMMDSWLILDKHVKNSLKTEFAEETLLEVHKPRLDQYASAVKSLLCNLKKPAIAALLRFLKNPLHPSQAVQCGDILADVIITLSKKEKTDWKKIYDFCQKSIKNKFDCEGRLFLVLGKMTHSEACNEETTEDIGDYLFLHLCKTSFPFLILEALGWSASSPFATWEHKTEVVQLYQTLMDRKLPKQLSQEYHLEKGIIYAFDAKTTAYTDLLPSILQGFQRIGLAQETPNSLRQVIVQYLLKKWQAIITTKIIWSPKNTTDLAEVLTNLCLDQHLNNKDKATIVEALYKKIDIFFVAQLLTKLLANIHIPEIIDTAQKTTETLLDFIQSNDYKSPEDREDLLNCISQLIQSPKLAPTKKATDNLREKLLYALYEGLRDEIHGVQDTLRQLQTSPYLTKKQKTEIARRLA